ncbi:MAG: glutamate 5-kinase [Opitutales bacterium]
MVPLTQAKRIVVKLGTGVLTSGIGELDTARIASLCRQLGHLRRRGIQIVIVSSGAVGLGMGKLGLERRPRELASLQACAAVGQSILINTWQKGFDPDGLTVAQVLLTREDLRAHHRHTAVFNTLERLLARGTVPVVNENDTVSAAEIKFGDNDTLSALVASVIQADLLFILSNIPGLIDRKGSGEVVPHIPKITPKIEAMAEGTRHTTSVGGMVSKINAAKIAHRTGCGVFIGSGGDEALFEKLLSGETTGTYIDPSPTPIKAHKRWLAIQDNIEGTLTIDAGAAEAVLHKGKSLLAAGVSACSGDFEAGDLVRILSPDNKPIAHGIVGFSSEDLQDLSDTGPASSVPATPQLASTVVVHRDNLVLLG